MGAIKNHYHETISKSQQTAAMAPKEKCKKHKWTTEDVDYPYKMCTICGTLEIRDEVPDPEIWDDDNDDDEIIGYQCLGCGHMQDHPGECDMCMGSAVDPMYF
jgi:hypothetical protein